MDDLACTAVVECGDDEEEIFGRRKQEEHLITLRDVFTRLRDANSTTRPTKCYVRYREVEFLGHVVGNGKLKVKYGKVQAVKEAKRPVTKSQMRSFLGLVGYYRKFVDNFASIAAPLSDVPKKGQPNVLVWNDDVEKAFQVLKIKLCVAPILQLADINF